MLIGNAKLLLLSPCSSIEIVDNVLADDDIDDDGYLTYPEYIIARRREEAREEMENKGGNAKGH